MKSKEEKRRWFKKEIRRYKREEREAAEAGDYGTALDKQAHADILTKILEAFTSKKKSKNRGLCNDCGKRKVSARRRGTVCDDGSDGEDVVLCNDCYERAEKAV